jgi:membrane-associated phospholipid phosphatase
MDSSQNHPPAVGWLEQCRARLRTCWVEKMLGTTAGMAAFFSAYFWLLRHPLHPARIMPRIAADHWVPFWPWALPLYLSLWLYVSLVPALLRDRRELASYGAAAGALSAIGLGIFFLWPTGVPPSEIDWSRHPGFAFLKSVDASGNACPSLHVAFAVFTAVWFGRLLGATGAPPALRAVNWLWCLGILYSTVATRQHVALDVAAGAALGAAVALAPLRWFGAARRRSGA